jgi:hypothetical protein
MNCFGLRIAIASFVGAMVFAAYPALAYAAGEPSQSEASDYIDKSNKELAAYKGTHTDGYEEACGSKHGEMKARLDAASFKTPIGLKFVASNVGMADRYGAVLFIMKNACSGKASSATMRTVKVFEFVASDKEFLSFNKATGVFRFGARVNSDYSGNSADIIRTVEKSK